MWSDDELVLRVHSDVVDVADISDEVLRMAIYSHAPLIGDEQLQRIVSKVQSRTVGYDVLDPFLSDPTVTEVMVNGNGYVWLERFGQLERTDVQLDGSVVVAILERIVAPLGLRIDRSSPVVDARLSDGSRVHAVIPPLAIDGPCLTIRRFPKHQIDLEQLTTSAIAHFLQWAIAARYNIVVCGGAGAGKTTLLNALAKNINDKERIITIEDAAELQFGHRHVVRLEARPANAEGIGEVRVRDLVRNALRMRPDRIIVGEVRSGEAIDMLQAMNTGHAGSLSTCHANSPSDALRRLETLVLMGDVALPLAAVREQLMSALDLIVAVGRRPDGGRHITQIAQVETTVEYGAPISLRVLADEHALLAAPTRPTRFPISDFQLWAGQTC